jgi:hypothetical protein
MLPDDGSAAKVLGIAAAGLDLDEGAGGQDISEANGLRAAE